MTLRRPALAPVSAPAIVPKVSLMKARDEALTVAGVLVPQLQALVAKPILASASKTFLAIDDMVAKLKASNKTFKEQMASPRKKINEALQELRTLENEVTAQYEEAIKAGNDWMVSFKTEEARLQAIEQKAIDDARIAAEEEIARKQKLIEQAKTPQMKARLTNQVQAMATEVSTLVATPCKPPVEAANSVSRKTLKVQINDKKKLIAHILKLSDTPGGEDLLSLIEVDMVQMNAFRKLDFARTKRTTPGEWLPGVSVIEEMGMMGYRRG